jgi:hypothetical protein
MAAALLITLTAPSFFTHMLSSVVEVIRPTSRSVSGEVKYRYSGYVIAWNA